MVSVILAAYGTVPYNDRRFLVEPDVRVILPRQSPVNRFHLLFSSVRYTKGWKTAALRRTFRWRWHASYPQLVCGPRGRRQRQFLETLVQGSPAPHEQYDGAIDAV